MLLDTIASIQLTISAAILVAAVSIFLGPTLDARLRVVVGLAVWFCVVAAIGATQLIGRLGVAGTPLLGVLVGAPITVLWIVASRSPSLRESLAAAPMRFLVALNILRVLGVCFLFLRDAGRVAPTFASIAGWGDIATGLLAIPAFFAASPQRANARGLVLLWNIFGLLDLVTAVSLGVVSSESPLRLIHEPVSSAVMGTLPWLLIPGYLVPLLACSHLAIFWQLSRARSVVASAFQPAPAAARARIT